MYTFFSLNHRSPVWVRLTPLERDAATQPSGHNCSPPRFFKLSCGCLRPCDFFHFYVLVYPSRGVVHFFYYRSEFQSRFCRVGLKADEVAFCIALLWCESTARSIRGASLETPASCDHMSWASTSYSAPVHLNTEQRVRDSAQAHVWTTHNNIVYRTRISTTTKNLVIRILVTTAGIHNFTAGSRARLLFFYSLK